MSPAADDVASVDGGDRAEADGVSRRGFLSRSARTAAYVAPVVLLFRPRQAIAGSGGSAITPG